MEKAAMVKTRLYYAVETDTLDLWVDEPGKEYIAEPLNDNMVLKLDREGNIIGLEIISLEKLEAKDMEKLPETIRKTLQKTLENITLKTRKLT